MNTRSVTVTAAFVAAASFAASTTRAGDTPPLFLWTNPVDGLWSAAGNWSPQGVPGVGAFTGAEARIDALGATPYVVTLGSAVSLSTLTLGGNAVLLRNAPLTLSGDLLVSDSAWIEVGEDGAFQSGVFAVHGNASFESGTRFNAIWGVLDVRGVFRNDSHNFSARSATLNRNNTLQTRDANHGSARFNTLIAGFFENTGVLSTSGSDSTLLFRDLLNTGDINIFDSTSGAIIDDDFTNRGRVRLFPANATARFSATRFIHEGVFQGESSGAVFELIGSHHHFINPDPFVNTLRVELQGQGVAPMTLNGALDTGAQIVGRAESLVAHDELRFRAATSFVVEQHADFRAALTTSNFSLAAQTATFAESITSSGPLTLNAQGDLRFEGDIAANGVTTLRAASIHATGHNSFTGSLTIREADALFDNSFVVDGSLVVQQGASMKFADGAALRATGNITWSNPGSLLDVPIVAGGQAIIGARRVEAEVTANFIRLGAGTMELAADITSNTTVIIAGTALSLGARGEFTHATIDADVATTFALNQSWLFDVGFDGARGPASDLLTITGSAQLYGVLNVDLVGNPASLRAGDEFTLLTAASIDGAFLAMNLPTLTGALSWDYFQTNTALGLRVIPSPGAGTLLALVALAHARRDRRSTPTL